MNRKQKIILAVFALADVLVIGLLGSYVFRDLGQGASVSPAIVDTDPACTGEILRAFETAFGPGQKNVMVTWSHEQGSISVVLTPSEERGFSVDENSSETEPPLPETVLEPTPQLLWVVFDTLASELPEACPTPDAITVSISMSSPAEVARFIAQVEGKYLRAWRQGIIDDDTFTGLVRYRDAGAPNTEPQRVAP